MVRRTGANGLVCITDVLALKLSMTRAKLEYMDKAKAGLRSCWACCKIFWLGFPTHQDEQQQ